MSEGARRFPGADGNRSPIYHWTMVLPLAKLFKVAPVVPSPGITGLRGSGNGECWRDQLAFRDPKVDADAKGAAKCCKYVKLSQNLKSIAIETFPTLASLWSWYR